MKTLNLVQEKVAALQERAAEMLSDVKKALARDKAAALTLATIALMTVSGAAHAFTIPVAGSFAYDAFDLVVNQILKGPIGFVGGVVAIVFGATQLLKSWVIALFCIIGGAIAVRADAVVQSLGALV